MSPLLSKGAEQMSYEVSAVKSKLTVVEVQKHNGSVHDLLQDRLFISQTHGSSVA